jgi:hypothetical protein
MFPIPIYIGISEKFKITQGLTERSILRNTSAPVEITHLYPVIESGCTGFTNVRYGINHGIYLDCDMIVLGDIAELWSYYKKDYYVCMEDGSSEVAVIGCSHFCRDKNHEYLIPKLKKIPMIWNVEDEIVDGMKLLHFTNLKTQPWFSDHPNNSVINLYNEYL